MFASNLNEAKNGRFVSTTPWLYTAKHRKQRFEARTSTRLAKSTLMILVVNLAKNSSSEAQQNLNLPYKPLESILSRADLSTELSAERPSQADIIIYHHYHPPLSLSSS